MNDTNHVLIIGAGAWGTTLSSLVVRAGHRCTLYSRNEDVCRSLRQTRRHPTSLPRFVLPETVEVISELDSAIAAEPDVVVVAVPAAGIDDVAGRLADATFRGTIVAATKGIDPATLRTSTERIGERVGGSDRIAALSGPNLAMEIACGLPAAAVVASVSQPTAMKVQRSLMSPAYRIYTSTDVVGVELAGALKNVIAIGAGIGDGLEAGENAKAAFITRGIAEMTRLGVACGSDPMTFAGLAGIGDLMATCNSTLSRNHTVGRRIARGERLTDILGDMSEVAEGVPTTRAAVALGRKFDVELPITTQMARVLFDGVAPRDALAELMARDAKGELERS